MPIYVYECNTCADTVEVIEPASHDEPVECICGGTMRRVVTGHAKTPGKWTVA